MYFNIQNCGGDASKCVWMKAENIMKGDGKSQKI